MANPDVKKLLKLIESSVKAFDKDIPVIQKRMLRELQLFLKDIELNSGNIKNSVYNIGLLNKLKTKIDSIVLTDDYKDRVVQFAKAFGVITEWHDNYFSSITTKFKKKPVFEAIKKNAIDWTIEGLTDRATLGVSDGIRDLLNRNITGGGNYSDLLDQMRNYIITNDTGDGALQRYSKQITTDALNQYSAQYNRAISADLGLKWRRYVGSLLETSREFCVQLTEKEFYHISELPEILKGHIDGNNVRINPKTDLWYGAIKGTNTANFSVNRGGHQCGHQDLGVSDAMVPENLRKKFEGK